MIESGPNPESIALITDPTSLLIFFSGFVALIFLASKSRVFAPLFRYVPPFVWIYLLPVFGTTWGLTPSESPLYDWCTVTLLPAALILLTVSTDLKAIARLGPLALAMVFAGTVGIVIGGPIALALFQSQLHPEMWKGLGALAGSWIGGGSNMLAIKEGLGCPNEIFSPVIIVDSVVGYGWMSIMIAFSGYQSRIDKLNQAHREVLDDLNERLAAYKKANSRPMTLPSFSMILGLGLAGGWCCMRLGEGISSAFTGGVQAADSIMSPYTWGVLVVLVVGIGLSFTPARRLESEGASVVGYGGLYILVATMGAGGDLRALQAAPALLFLGIVWITIHAAVLVVALRLLRAPVFLFATGSMANVGGVISTPVIAGVFQPALAPVGILMGVVGNLVGTPAGFLCAWLMQKVAAAST